MTEPQLFTILTLTLLGLLVAVISVALLIARDGRQ